jgi:hypothetical protein
MNGLWCFGSDLAQWAERKQAQAFAEFLAFPCGLGWTGNWLSGHFHLSIFKCFCFSKTGINLFN